MRERTKRSVRGAHLAEAIMVELVVLDVPGLDHHPIQPIAAASEERTNPKGEAVVALALVAFIEAAVADVVADDRPP